MANSGLPTSIDGGDETDEDVALREWFAKQEMGGVARLEETAKSILQIVMGVFSVLIAVLLLAESPTYLEDAMVRHFGVASVLLFFISLAAASLILIPFPVRYERNNLTRMSDEYKKLQQSKMKMLYVALGFFVAGSFCFGGLIIRALS